MPEELKDLIEKIQKDGVEEARKKAETIEEEAKKSARDIAEKAEREAERIIAEARGKVSQMEKNSRDSLKQAGRDFMLVLRKEINAVLNNIILLHTREALKTQEIVKIINTLVTEYEKDKRDITVLLGAEELKGLEKALLNELKGEIQKGITIRPSDDIRAGFAISYDKGKSRFDFTDKALAEYISSYLKPKLAEILGKDR